MMGTEPSDRAPLARRLGQLAWRFAEDCSGATAIEYAIMTFIGVAVLFAVNQLGVTVASMYERVQQAFVN